MQYAVVTPPGHFAFREVAFTIQRGLLALGHDSVQSSFFDLPNRRHIVLGVHCFNGLLPPPDSIVYQLEQYPWNFRPDLHRPYEVWDFSAFNVVRLRAVGIDAKHVPIGYVPELTHIQLSETPDVDVCFYGAPSARRQHILDGLRAAGLRVETLEADFTTRDALIARSKVVLNMHYADEPAIFEVVRVSYALANRALVVSERGEGWEPFNAGVWFADYDELVDACQKAVATANRGAITERGFEIVKSFDEKDILRKALA